MGYRIFALKFMFVATVTAFAADPDGSPTHKSATQLASLDLSELTLPRDATCEVMAQGEFKGFLQKRAGRRFAEVLENPRLAFSIFQRKLGPFFTRTLLTTPKETRSRVLRESSTATFSNFSTGKADLFRGSRRSFFRQRRFLILRLQTGIIRTGAFVRPNSTTGVVTPT